MKKFVLNTKRLTYYFFEGIAALIVFGIFRSLPFNVASAFGGWFGRVIGPSMPISRRAVKNLTRVFPEKPPSDINYIVEGMWDNLGRLVAEYPHLPNINIYNSGGEIEIIGVNYLDQLRDDGKPGIFFSAHMGNWEIIPLCGSQRGLPIDRVYRAANNRLVEWLYSRGRASINGSLIPKGPQGVKDILKSLRNGQHLGVLMDQKMNDGISIPFFGMEAMTASAFAALALRFDCPMVPVHIERRSGTKFRIIFEPPLTLEKTGDKKKDIHLLMVQVNNIIEGWIKIRPEQWLWLHNRWSD